MKLRKDPLFIGATLLLFYPLGLILTLRSNFKRKIKTIFILLGAILNLCILCFAIYNPSKSNISKELQIKVSRNTLEVGQSGAVALYGQEIIDPNIELIPENDCLSISGTVYTAKKIGNCDLIIKHGHESTSIPIVVTADHGGDEIVYLTQGGKRYHKNKSHCRKNILKMTREEAIQTGKTPCKICY